MSPEHFFIIGAQRSGTTYLYQILDEHPEIQMAKPLRPEPKYFLSESEDFSSRDAYFQRYFKLDSNVLQYGEKSTSYMEHIQSGARIQELLPDSRIVIILRNPVDRAISNYFFTRKHGLETRSIEEVFLDEVPGPDPDDTAYSVNPFDYINRGIYANHLKEWFDLFPARQINILIFEQFIGHADRISRLYNWLNVKQNFIPVSISEKVNHGDGVRAQNREVTRVLAQRYIYHNQRLGHFLQTDLSFGTSTCNFRFIRLSSLDFITGNFNSDFA